MNGKDYSSFSDFEFARAYKNFVDNYGAEDNESKEASSISEGLANEMTLRMNAYNCDHDAFLRRFGQLEGDKKSPLEKKLRKSFVASARTKNMASLKETKTLRHLGKYVKQIGRTPVFMTSAEVSGRDSKQGVIYLKDAYTILGVRFEGDGFNYDNRIAMLDEKDEDFFNRLEYSVKPLEVIEEDNQTFIILGSS